MAIYTERVHLEAIFSRRAGEERNPWLDDLRFLAGHPTLDYANSVDPREGGTPREYLNTFDDVVAWSQKRGLVSPARGKRLHEIARQDPAAARAAFNRAIELREAIYRVFSTIARGRAPQDRDLRQITERFAAGIRIASFHPKESSWALDLELASPDPRELEYGQAASAVDLLRSEVVGRLKICPGLGDCGWVFLDMTKNRSRRWCSMEMCGTRVKLHRLHERRRKAHARPVRSLTRPVSDET